MPSVSHSRDALFDPLLSTDLPFAKRAGVKPIQRSVLYQKMNLLPKNRDGSTLNIDWNDKDEGATEGKKSASHPVSPPPRCALGRRRLF